MKTRYANRVTLAVWVTFLVVSLAARVPVLAVYAVGIAAGQLPMNGDFS